MENTPNPKCTRCKCYWKPDETDIKTSGLTCKTCKKCRLIHKKSDDTNKCPHGKRKSRCRECGGTSFCEHNRIKSECKDCNFKFYLVKLQRGSIHRCLNQSKLHKSKHSIEYLGCSVEYLIECFKKKMENFNLHSEVEMTWDNIHIDHIKPVSSFNLDDEDEFLSCCHYTNLQPLLVIDNLSKSCKWNDKDDIFWKENIKDNEEYYDIYLPI